MFGKDKKSKEEKVSTAVINPNEFQGTQELPEVQQQSPQQIEQPIPEVQPVQQVQQPVQQPQQIQQPQAQQQPTQQIQQIPIAYIKKAEVIPTVEGAIFQYVIETNYPLAIGTCEVRQ